MRVTVLGAGSWGTALAKLLADAGHETALWTHSPDQARDLAERRENVKYLPGAKLPSTLAPTADLDAALAGTQMVVSVVPSHVTREVLSRAAERISADVPVVTASKGIEISTGATMADVLTQVLRPGA